MAQQPGSISCDRIRDGPDSDLRIARLPAVTKTLLSPGIIEPQSTGPTGTILLGDQPGPSSMRDVVVRSCRYRRLVERKLVARILVVRFRLDCRMDECRCRHHRRRPVPERQYPLH